MTAPGMESMQQSWVLVQVLLKNCFTAICAGGGGIPVVVDSKGGLAYRRHGVEAVIDKVSPSLTHSPNLPFPEALLRQDARAILRHACKWHRQVS